MSAKFRFVFLAVFSLAVVLSAARLEHTTYTAHLNVDSSGDTAQVVKLDTSSINNSYAYIDTINDTVISWTSPSSNTTDSMIYDSMVTAINAHSYISQYVTAYDSTTFYIIQSDDVGLAFTVKSDTAQDTITTQANVTSNSTYQDTFKIVRMVWDDFEVSGIDFWVFLDSSITTTNQGFGLSDSGYVWIYKGRVRHGVEELVLVDSVASNALPCSLHIQITADTTGGSVDPDTIWYEYWSMVYRIADTTSDTVMNPTYVIWVDYKLIGK